MKKALSIVLAVLMIFSTMGVMAFAADDTQKVKYIFKNGEDVIADITVSVTISAQELVPHLPANPVKKDTDTTRYTFKGWDYAGDEDDTLYYANANSIPTPATLLAGQEIEAGTTPEFVFTAEFSEEDISGRQSFWNFIESIFERLNMIFAYFAEIFGW